MRTAAMLWLASKVGLAAIAWLAVWTLRPGTRSPLPWAGLWEHWDAFQFRLIAEYGYFAPGNESRPNQSAFLPGYPLLLRAAHFLVPNWTLAELALGTVASFLAVLGIVRLAQDFRRGSGVLAGALLLAAPAAVFLSVGYSESPFLAFALPAWLAGRRGRWPAAALFAAGACSIRVSGLFLLAGLAVMALLGPNTPRGVPATGAPVSRRVRALCWLGAGLLPLAAYAWYLRARTGDWLAWQHAEDDGWRRRFGDPLTTLSTTWQVAFGHLFRTPLALAFQLELLGMLMLVVAIGLLALSRQWPEACYCALTAAALAAGHWYFSVPRAVLLAFPLWCGMARIGIRHAFAAALWLAISVPLMFATALLYLSGRWAG